MKALPPSPSQLELWSNGRQLLVVENDDRQRVLRALAEILLVAADVAVERTKEDGDEAP